MESKQFSFFPRFLFEELCFEDEKIKFHPAILVQAKHDLGEFFEIEFDFGLKLEYKMEKQLEIHEYNRECCRVILYLLNHSFFHCQHDPNYTVENWAIWGNLKDRMAINNFD